MCRPSLHTSGGPTPAYLSAALAQKKKAALAQKKDVQDENMQVAHLEMLLPCTRKKSEEEKTKGIQDLE